MPIRLNLNHEIESAQKESRRDPLKLGMLLIVAIIFLMAIYYIYRLSSAHSLNQQSMAVQNEWKTVSLQEKKAEVRAKELEATTTTASALMGEIKGRFFWAPFLSEISMAAKPDIQITRFSGKVNASATAKTIQVEISGIAAGETPRQTAENFRKALEQRIDARYTHFAKDSAALNNLANFNGNLIDGTPVSLNGKSLNTVTFVINLEFPISAAKPAAAKHPSRKRK